MVHVSDRAMQHVLMTVESSRGRGCAFPDATTPFTVICALPAGMRRLHAVRLAFLFAGRVCHHHRLTDVVPRQSDVVVARLNVLGPKG